jgi:hypothetical protein
MAAAIAIPYTTPFTASSSNMASSKKPACGHADGNAQGESVFIPLPEKCRLVGTRTARAWSGVIAASQTGLPQIIPKKRCRTRPLSNQRRLLCPVCLRIYGTFYQWLLQYRQSMQNFPLALVCGEQRTAHLIQPEQIVQVSCNLSM